MPSEKMRLIHSFRGAECESITSRSDLWRPYQLTFLYASLPLLPEDVVMQDLTSGA